LAFVKVAFIAGLEKTASAELPATELKRPEDFSCVNLATISWYSLKSTL
jgi:hypothetical protein